MNRIVVRLLVAFLAVIAVTAVSQLAAAVFVVVMIARGIPEASLQKVGATLEKALEAANPTSTPEETYVLVALLLASFFVAVVLAVLLARRIALPLEGVSRAATRVALGEWTARAPLPPREARGGSETARLVRNFNRMAENLESLESERKATVAAIAHELRTPLTVLRGRLEAVRDGVLEGTSEEYTVLISQVELLSRLVTDLRTLSLADAGQLSLERQELDLALLLRSVVSSFETRALEKGVRLEVQAPEPVRLRVDSERLHQVIGNLLENALRHTSEGFVRVSLEMESDTVRLRVRDTGSGIPPEALAHLFERFYRAESSRARVSGGSGLGLAIVRAIVSLHEGRIEARNHPDGGAEFTVTLPRHGALQPALPPRHRVKRARKQAPQRLEPQDRDGFIAPGTLTAAIYHALSFPLGLAYVLMLVVGLSVGLATCVIFIGFPILLLTLGFVGYAANLERWLNDSLLGVPVRFSAPLRRGNLWQRLGWGLRDPMTWRALLYVLMKLPFALVTSLGLLVLSVVSVVLTLTPVIRILVPAAQINLFSTRWGIDQEGQAIWLAVIGLALGLLTTWLCNVSAQLWAQFAGWLLGERSSEARLEMPPSQQLEARS